MEPENNQEEIVTELEQKQDENTQLFEQLTNKNRNYMVKLNRSLEEANMPAEQRTEIFNDMLKTLIENQASGITARQIYGTVNDQTRTILTDPQSKEEEVERSEDWKIYLDGALMLGGLFAVITGLSAFFGEEGTTTGMGILTLLLNFLIGGGVVLVITKNAPVPGQKGGILRYVLVSAAAMLVWMVLMSLVTVLIPPSINLFVPGWFILLIGIAAFVAKWYFKRKLNIKGTLI